MKPQNSRDEGLDIGGDGEWQSITEAIDLKGTKYRRFALTGGTYTVTIPPQSEADGIEFEFFYLSGSGTVTIQDRDDAVLSARNYVQTLDAPGEGLIVKGNGRCYNELFINE
jgi:hypothetical protein